MNKVFVRWCREC